MIWRLVALLLIGLAVAALSIWYVVVAPWGLPHDIWVLELAFIAGALAALADGTWLIGLAVRRIFMP